jgi:phospholipase/carboxylesterase
VAAPRAMTTRGTLAGFEHRFDPGDADAMPLLLLHGTGGDENDLIPLGRALAPSAPLLSPRGPVLEHGAPRFFRRLAEGVFDLDDLARRTRDLARFVREASTRYGFEGRRPIAVGFSNGANIAASVLLAGEDVLHGAVLFRAMTPFEPAALPDLRGVPVLMVSGRRDPIVPIPTVERLARLFTDAGAAVTLRWDDGAHGIGQAEVAAAAAWLADVARAASGAGPAPRPNRA